MFIQTMFKVQPQASQLCDHCHTKPKHVGHPYCSRTCAKEAGTVASNKTCLQCHQRPKYPNSDFCSKTCARAAQGAKPFKGPNQQQNQPVQTERAAAPQDNSSIRLQAPAHAVFPTVPVTTPTPPAPLSRSPPVHTSIPPLAQTTKCRIDECSEPVATDMRGLKISDYCSQEHAEDAVLSGLAKACVMCLRMPQSDRNYFCSQACKDRSMHK